MNLFVEHYRAVTLWFSFLDSSPTRWPSRLSILTEHAGFQSITFTQLFAPFTHCNLCATEEIGRTSWQWRSRCVRSSAQEDAGRNLRGIPDRCHDISHHSVDCWEKAIRGISQRQSLAGRLTEAFTQAFKTPRLRGQVFQTWRYYFIFVHAAISTETDGNDCSYSDC